ncbi:MAG TPA: hypothetical protein VGL56_12535 [Fimbriimonadaceae bacterium]|jgi:hypothetical protein
MIVVMAVAFLRAFIACFRAGGTFCRLAFVHRVNAGFATLLALVAEDHTLLHALHVSSVVGAVAASFGTHVAGLNTFINLFVCHIISPHSGLKFGYAVPPRICRGDEKINLVFPELVKSFCYR